MFFNFLGVGVFPSQDPVQLRMPPWIYNESLVPGKKSFFVQDSYLDTLL